MTPWEPFQRTTATDTRTPDERAYAARLHDQHHTIPLTPDTTRKATR